LQFKNYDLQCIISAVKIYIQKRGNKMKKITYAMMIISFFILSFSPAVFAETQVKKTDSNKFNPDPKVMLKKLLENHQEIKSLKHRVESAEAVLEQSRGMYYPSIDLFGDTGRERIRREGQDDTTEYRHELTLKASQLITDFGRTTNAIKHDEIFLQQARAHLESTSSSI